MTEGLKWTVNHVAKSDDKHLELMSEDNVKKANEFHKSFPQYTVTPLQDLAELASYLGVKSIHCKDESYRFGLMGCQPSWTESCCTYAERNNQNTF